MGEQTRAWTYRVGAAAILALIVVDVIQGGDASEWVAWIAGAIGLGTAGLATKNTSTRRPPKLSDHPSSEFTNWPDGR